MKANWDKINELRTKLAENRIKENIDYSIICKYDKVTLTCFTLYKEEIRQEAMLLNLSIDQWFTYDF